LVDAVAEFDDERAVARRQETHFHRVPWYTCANGGDGRSKRGGGMAKQINLNADMGEGFGAYDIGDDAGLLKIIRSASIACGFHAGDPVTMQRLVTDAVAQGVSIGAHPGFNDLWGFGRRRIDMNPRELEYMIAYQIGALQGMACYAGAKVTHLKPHGALNNMAAEDLELALAIGRAIKTVDRDIIYVALAGSAMEKAGRELGLPVAREGFCDRLYDDDGNLTSRKIPGAVLHDPEVVKERVVDMVLNEEIVSRNGKPLRVRLDTLCVHGDEPSGVIVARAARQGLEAAGVRVIPLPEMALG
jgi:5-oxoprolinase (ATP-hydrolysing) subunit A